jgi:Holliday junction resolvase RusA-like endonuclease
MSFVLEFEIEGLPKMTNTMRVHWRVIQKERKLWKERVRLAVLNNQLNGARQFKPLTRAEVSITRFSSRQPDFDGMVSAGKSLLDGLVEAQVLIDDSQQVIGQPKYYWEQSRPGKGKVRVRVEALA